MQQHAEPVDRDVAAGRRRFEQRGAQRRIDDIGHDGARRQIVERDLQRRLAGQAERGRIDQQRRIAQRGGAGIPGDGFDTGAQLIGQPPGGRKRPVGDPDQGGAGILKGDDHRPRRAARAENHRRSGRGGPARGAGTQRFDKAVPVGIAPFERAGCGNQNLPGARL